MVEPTEHGNAHHTTLGRQLDGTREWGIVIQRQMSSGLVIVREVLGQDLLQVLLAQ